MPGGNAGPRLGGVAPNPKPDPRAVLEAYDVLPPIVRQAVAGSAFDWDAPRILRELRSGNWTPAAMVEFIRDYDTRHSQQR